jgi:hypothetical protein
MRAASLVAVVALALAAPAAAADSLKVGALDASDYPTIRASVVTSTPSKVAPTVRENGSPVVGLQVENLARAKSIALAIDRSRSMDGTALADAIQAARSFVASKSPNDRIMLIGFGRQAIRLTTSPRRRSTSTRSSPVWRSTTFRERPSTMRSRSARARSQRRRTWVAS